MRNFKIVCLLSLAITMITLGACKKDDPIHNFFMYELIKYEVDEGILEYYGKLGDLDDAYNFDVTLYSTGVGFDPLAGTFNGVGNLVVLEMFSDSPDKLSPGTYTYDIDASHDPFTFDIGRLGLFVNIDEQSGTFILINSGTVKVSKSGDNYTFVFDCMTSTDKDITGSYTGTLDFYDLSAK